MKLNLFLILLAVSVMLKLQAAVLQEDRADILYHSFDGGGVEITGPSILVRKKFSESISAGFNHYVDNVSSASIDVITTASPYTEHRDENSISVDYLSQKTTISFGFANSIENDYDATTFSFNISQDFFGDLTTLSAGFGVGDNKVGKNGDPDFKEDANTRNYRLSLSQIMTRNLIVSMALEVISDEGYLNNPYRSVRYFDVSNTSLQYSYQSEIYPQTRTSTAVAVRAKYFLAPKSALSAGYRFYNDSWGIDAHTFEFGYSQPIREHWELETSLRFYQQDSAEFYNDLFPFVSAQNFLARDKELSRFTTTTLGAGFSYEFSSRDWSLIKRGRVNFFYDYILFDYDNFRDLTSTTSSVGQEPLYSFDAGVIRAYASVWF
ncbi:MAG: hypothetical protein ACI8XC_004421 [Gammaproteobacteria bacterium]|jgi:hypothetical protein